MILVVKSILIFLIFFHQHLNSQNIETIGTQESFKTKIWEDLRKASSTSPTSFHITTDRNWYFTGDEIWFKVYLLTSGLPETRSGVLYVDLSDSTGHVLIKKKLLISDFGTSYGVIHLLEDHKSGWYSLRVQTEWNRNFNHGFEKPIYVNARGNLPPDISITKIVSEKERVCLFPEGGNFVAGLQNRFAVKTVNENGNPEPGQLFVIDTISKDTLTKFKTSSNGLGQFTLTPNQSQNIIVFANWANGKVSKHSLPAMILSGITLQTSLVSEKLYYKIESNKDFTFEGDEILFAAVMHNEVVFSKLFRKANETFTFSSYIPMNSFPAGVISLRLYSSTGKLVAMRNVYNHKERQAIADGKLIRFEPKVKNEITISLPDTLFGTYSVGITDADLIRPDIIDPYTKEENILNENPFTLFQLYQSLGKEIDLYLLTLHDNFKQAAAIDSISEIKFNHEAGINIAGKIEYERPGYQISGSVINFFPKNLAYGNFILTDTLDSKGNFRLQNLLVPDSTVLYWKINGFDKKNENKLKLTLNESWFDSLRLRPTLFKEKNLIKKEDAKSTTQTVLNKYYETDSLYNVKSKTLKEVTVFSTRKNRVEELEQKYAGASLFAGKLGFASTYDLEEEKGFYFSVFTYLQTRVPGLKVLGNFDNPLLI